MILLGAGVLFAGFAVLVNTDWFTHPIRDTIKPWWGCSCSSKGVGSVLVGKGRALTLAGVRSG